MDAEFRLDAGFGSYQNVALLAEMGYEVYTKSPSQGLTDSLKRQFDATTIYTRVGANAEMVAWPQRVLTNCPYPVDVRLLQPLQWQANYRSRNQGRQTGLLSAQDQGALRASHLSSGMLRALCCQLYPLGFALAD